MNLHEVLSGIVKTRNSKPIDVKELIQALEKTGRGGDTKLVHVTSKELAALKEMGSGTKNPTTGLMEFRDSGGEAGGQGDPRGGGGSGPGDPGGPGGPGGGGGGGERGGGIGLGRADVPDPDALEAAMSRADPFGPHGAPAATGPDRADVGESDVGRGMGLGLGDDAVSPEGNANETISNMIDVLGLFGMPALAGFGLSNVGVVDDDPGMPGFGDLSATIGKGIGSFGGPSAGTVGPADPTAAGHTGISGPDPQGADRDIPPGPPPGPPVFPSLQRPGEIPAPGYLGIQQAMTPLQQRSLLATRGVSGDEGSFRSQEAQDFYQNLFMRDIIGDDGQIASNAQVLPVEAQYMQDIMGLNATADMDIERFARAMQGLPLDPPPAAAPAAPPPDPRAR